MRTVSTPHSLSLPTMQPFGCASRFVGACVVAALVGLGQEVLPQAGRDTPGVSTRESVEPVLLGEFGRGRLERINGYLVLHVAGTASEMGEQHGRLLRDQVRRMVRDLIREGEGAWGYERLIDGTRVMESFLPQAFRDELLALARAAEVRYEDVVAAQLFGDVWRGTYCTSYAVFGAATRGGRCMVGRNMDYWDHGVSQYGAVLIHFTPEKGLPFLTVSWAGIINGWTAMNQSGIVVANNSGYGGRSNSLEGLSTCFVLRKIAQFAATVKEGVGIIETTPRAVGTNMIIAGGKPASAAIVEFDHESVAVCWDREGVVLAANDFRALYRQTDGGGLLGGSSRYGILAKLIGDNYGRIDESMNFAAAPGVPIDSMNLHCVLLSTDDLRLRVAMGGIPAYRRPFKVFRMTNGGIVGEVSPAVVESPEASGGPAD